MALTSSSEDSDAASPEHQSQSQELPVQLKIVNESTSQFKIKWAGRNPNTGEPWSDSWVTKHLVNEELMPAWERTKAEGSVTFGSSSAKGKGKASASASASASAINTRRKSAASDASPKPRASTSTAAARQSTVSSRSRRPNSSPPLPSPPPPHYDTEKVGPPRGKRKRSDTSKSSSLRGASVVAASATRRRNATASSSKLAAPAPMAHPESEDDNCDDEELQIPLPPPPRLSSIRPLEPGPGKRKRTSSPAKGKVREAQPSDDDGYEEEDQDDDRPRTKRRKVESTVKHGKQPARAPVPTQTKSHSSAGRQNGATPRKSAAVPLHPREEEDESSSHSEERESRRIEDAVVKREEQEDLSSQEEDNAADIEPEYDPDYDPEEHADDGLPSSRTHRNSSRTRGLGSSTRASSSKRPPVPTPPPISKASKASRSSRAEKESSMPPPPPVRTSTKRTTATNGTTRSSSVPRDVSPPRPPAKQPRSTPKGSATKPKRVREWSPTGSNNSDTNLINRPMTRGKTRADLGAAQATMKSVAATSTKKPVVKALPRPARVNSKKPVQSPSLSDEGDTSSESDDEVEVVEIRDEPERQPPSRTSSRRSLCSNTPSHRASPSKAGSSQGPSRQNDRATAARRDNRDTHNDPDRGPTPPSVAAGLSYPPINFVEDMDMYELTQHGTYTQAPTTGYDLDHTNGLDELNGSPTQSLEVHTRVDKGKGKEVSKEKDAPPPKKRTTLPSRRPAATVANFVRTPSGRHPSSRFVDDTQEAESPPPPSPQEEDNGYEMLDETIQIATQTQEQSPPPPIRRPPNPPGAPEKPHKRSSSPSAVAHKFHKKFDGYLSPSRFFAHNPVPRKDTSQRSADAQASSQIDQYSTPLPVKKRNGFSQDDIEDLHDDDPIEDGDEEDVLEAHEEKTVPQNRTAALQSNTPPPTAGWFAKTLNVFGLAQPSGQKSKDASTDHTSASSDQSHQPQLPLPQGHDVDRAKQDRLVGSSAAKAASQESATKGDSQDSTGAVKGGSSQPQWVSSAEIEPNGGLDKVASPPKKMAQGAVDAEKDEVDSEQAQINHGATQEDEDEEQDLYANAIDLRSTPESPTSSPTSPAKGSVQRNREPSPDLESQGPKKYDSRASREDDTSLNIDVEHGDELSYPPHEDEGTAADVDMVDLDDVPPPNAQDDQTSEFSNVSERTTDRMAMVLAQKDERIEELEKDMEEIEKANRVFAEANEQLSTQFGDMLTYAKTLKAELHDAQESKVQLQEALDKATSESEKKLAAAREETEFFRRQYNKASTYTDEMRKEQRAWAQEKMELEEAKTIVEKQRGEGLSAIKLMFQRHIEEIKADNKRLEQENTMLKELDRQTNGEDVRQKAAELEEFRPKFAELKQKFHEVVLERRKAEIALEEREKQTRRELVAEREEAAQRAALAQSEIELLTNAHEEALALMRKQYEDELVLVKGSFRQETRKREQESGLVVPCEWQVRPGERCPASFLHQEELLAHYDSHAETFDQSTVLPADSS